MTGALSRRSMTGYWHDLTVTDMPLILPTASSSAEEMTWAWGRLRAHRADARDAQCHQEGLDSGEAFEGHDDVCRNPRPSAVANL